MKPVLNYQVKTPILFIIFKRPEESLRVFEMIKQVRPHKLLLVSDGARIGVEGEEGLVEETRHLIKSSIDWDCEVFTNFADQNLGCKHRLASGITWGFAQEERLIILEDDCLPSVSFFQFCDEMLEKYTNDISISMVTGSNLLEDLVSTEGQYFTSKFGSIWGWASWRRAWQGYDLVLKNWEKELSKIKILNYSEKILYFNFLREVQIGKFDTWDYPWDFHRFKQNSKTIVPTKNLISNIGFGENSTHTIDTSSPFANRKTHQLKFPIHSQSNAKENQQYEVLYLNKLLKVNIQHYFKNILKYFLRKLHLLS